MRSEGHRTIIKRLPRVFWYAIAGLMIGVLVGLLIGSIGVAMRGRAFRIDTELVLAVIGALAGCWIGIKRDRKANRMKEAAN